MKLVIVFLIFFEMVMAKEVSVKTDDGFILKGFIEYPKIEKDKYPIIIFAHQYGTTHMIWVPFANELREKGYATLLIDLRGHGLSIIQNGKENKILFKENYSSFIELISYFRKSNKKVNFAKIPDDIALWIDYLIGNEKIDPENIILIGASLGATGIIPVSALQDVKAIIAISPGSPELMGKDRVKVALSLFLNPSLYIAAMNDPIGSNKYSLWYAKNSQNGTLILVPGKGHGVILLKSVKGYILEFLKNLE